jgi:hypothetical protein
MTLLPIPSEFLIYEEIFLFFFITVTRLSSLYFFRRYYIYCQFDLMLGLQGDLGHDFIGLAIEGAALIRPTNGSLQLAVRLLYTTVFGVLL